MIRVVAAALHLLALGLGLGAVLTRGNVLREPLTPESLKRAFRADNLWAAAAVLWLASGLWRLFGELEKTTSYYIANHWFLAKMGFFVLILILEVMPAVVLMRWRAALRRGESPAAFAPAPVARRIAVVSHIEALLVVAMIFAASAMARGFGIPGSAS